MLRIDFFRKATSIDELKEGNAIGNCTCDVIIEKELLISEEEFDYFSHHLVDISPLISKNEQFMFVDMRGIWHCLFVTTDDAADGIIVFSLGSGYARFSGYATKHQIRKNNL